MLRHAVNRIRDIASNLLEKSKPPSRGGQAARRLRGRAPLPRRSACFQAFLNL